MSFYRGKLKSLIVLGSVALALLPCLQQTHALCRLAGCIDHEELSPADIATAANSDSGGCCGSHKSEPCEFPPQDQGDGSPCGPECYFAQPADPREAPRDATESVSSEILAAFNFVAPKCDLDSHSLSNWASSAFDDLPFTSSCETCARLCRFLT